MMEKWKYGGSWWVRLRDGSKMNLNTEEAAETVLGLGETIESLEQKLHRREVRAAKKRRKAEGEDGVED